MMIDEKEQKHWRPGVKFIWKNEISPKTIFTCVSMAWYSQINLSELPSSEETYLKDKYNQIGMDFIVVKATTPQGIETNFPYKECQFINSSITREQKDTLDLLLEKL